MSRVHVPTGDDGTADGDTASVGDMPAMPDVHVSAEHTFAVLEAVVLLSVDDAASDCDAAAAGGDVPAMPGVHVPARDDGASHRDTASAGDVPAM